MNIKSMHYESVAQISAMNIQKRWIESIHIHYFWYLCARIYTYFEYLGTFLLYSYSTFEVQ